MLRKVFAAFEEYRKKISKRHSDIEGGKRESEAKYEQRRIVDAKI